MIHIKTLTLLYRKGDTLYHSLFISLHMFLPAIAHPFTAIITFRRFNLQMKHFKFVAKIKRKHETVS